MVDSRNLILDTDYPLDQVIYLKTGQFSGSGTSFAHNLGFTPLIVGTWSTSSTFPISMEGGYPGYEVFDPTAEYITFGANSTNISINRLTSQTGTRYFRIYGFMPTNVNVDVAETVSQSNNNIFNTDYNYTKIFLEGIATPSGSATTINHNLGYRPQVSAWIEQASGYITAAPAYQCPKVTTSSIIIPASSYNTHYKIYTDAQL